MSISARIEQMKEPRIAALAIQPGRRPGSHLQPSEMTSMPASGNASTSQP
jgi:hypothetical protein